jgi:hypothetical protein
MSVNTFLPPMILTPGVLLISYITQSYPMVITIVDSVENTYIVGQLIRLTIPFIYGMQQANQQTGQILEINGLDFNVNIDSTFYNPFTVPMGPQYGGPSLAPAGLNNVQFSNFTTNLPFKNLNNRGN